MIILFKDLRLHTMPYYASMTIIISTTLGIYSVQLQVVHVYLQTCTNQYRYVVYINIYDRLCSRIMLNNTSIALSHPTACGAAEALATLARSAARFRRRRRAVLALGMERRDWLHSSSLSLGTSVRGVGSPVFPQGEGERTHGVDPVVDVVIVEVIGCTGSCKCVKLGWQST